MEASRLNSIVLCKLEADLRIVARGQCFILQEKQYDANSSDKCVWLDKFYYGWIGGALRGYILYSLQRFARSDRSETVTGLVRQIEKLDKDINRIDANVTKRWQRCIYDPVEVFISHVLENDPIEKFIGEEMEGVMHGT